MCFHNCKELNVWTATTYISLKCRLALDCTVHRMLKLSYSSWGGESGSGASSNSGGTFDCCSSCVQMFPQMPVFKTNRNTLFNISN